MLSITNDKGIVIEDARDFAKELKIPNYSKLSYMLKCKDKIFNGRSEPHINEKSKEFCKKYNEFDFQNARSLKGYKKKKELKPIQTEIQFEKPHPINNILGISAEHTISNINQSQLYDLNMRMEKLEKLIAIRFQKVERFIRDWNGDNNNVN